MKAKKTSDAAERTPVIAPSVSGRSPTCGMPTVMTINSPPICRATKPVVSQIDRLTPLMTSKVRTASRPTAATRESTSTKCLKYCANPSGTAPAATMLPAIINQPVTKPQKSLKALRANSYSAPAEGNRPASSA